MPKFLEAKLKAEYPGNPHAVYGTLNAIGAMRGNKETAKGAAMEAKHAADVAKRSEKAGKSHGIRKAPGKRTNPQQVATKAVAQFAPKEKAPKLPKSVLAPNQQRHPGRLAQQSPKFEGQAHAYDWKKHQGKQPRA